MKTVPDSTDPRTFDVAAADDMVTVSRAEWDHIRTAGYSVVPNWMTRDPAVTDGMIRVYANLAGHCGAGGTWEMSHATIAKETGKSMSAVKRAVNELRALGVLDWSTPPRQKAGDPPRGCRYFVTHHPRPTVNPGPPVDPPLGHQRTTPPFTGELPPSPPVDYKEEPLEEPLLGDSVAAASLPLPGLPPSKGKRRASTTPLSPGWHPTAAHAAYAAEKGIDLPTEVMHFKLHADANDRRQVRWDATFSQWLINATKFARPYGQLAAVPVRTADWKPAPDIHDLVAAFDAEHPDHQPSTPESRARIRAELGLDTPNRYQRAAHNRYDRKSS